MREAPTSRARRPAARRGCRGARLGSGRRRRSRICTASRSQTSALDALDGADAAVVVTEWPELRELDWAERARAMRTAARSSTGATCSIPRSCARSDSPTRASAAPDPVSLPAVILVGGQGTRLRPLTDRTRKDMLHARRSPAPRISRSSTSRAAELSARSSRCGYLPDQLEAHFGERHGGLSLEYAVEDEPLGRGGGIASPLGGLERTASSR